MRLVLREGAIYDSNDLQLHGPWTHFVGWLIEEDMF
jgi:hypothetical protein